MSYIKKSSIEGEKIIKLFDLHYSTYLFPILITVLIAKITDFDMKTTGLLISALMLFYLIPNVYVEYSLTNKRAVNKKGVLTTKTEEMKLNQVETVEMSQSFLGKILNYGEIKITGTGSSDVKFRKVASPFQVKKIIETSLEGK